MTLKVKCMVKFMLEPQCVAENNKVLQTRVKLLWQKKLSTSSSKHLMTFVLIVGPV